MTMMTPVLINKPVFFITVKLWGRMLFGTLADDRALSYLEKRFLGTLNDVAVISDLFDLPDDAAVSDDLIVDLKLRDHVLQLLALSLLRKDYEEIEDAEDKEEWQNRRDPPETTTASVLKK